MLKQTIALVIFLLLPARLWAATYYVSSGVGGGAVAAGSNSISGSANPCTNPATPCLTTQYAYSVIGSNGAGHTLLLRGGQHDTVNGWVQSGTSAIPNGTSWNAPFKVHAYPGDCHINTCEAVTMVRGLNCTPGVGGCLTIAQMQGTNCGGKDCVGAPTLEECISAGWTPANGSGYPGNCWAGQPSPGLYLRFDRSGQVTGGVIEQTFNAHKVEFVDFSGIVFDARGINANLLAHGVGYDHVSNMKNIRFRKGEFKNAVGSCFAQPGIGGVDAGSYAGTWNGNPFLDTYVGLNNEFEPVLIPNNGTRSVEVAVDANGNSKGVYVYQNFVGSPLHASDPGVVRAVVYQARYTEGAPLESNLEFLNDFKLTNCGIPFNTYMVGGVNAREHTGAKYLHGWYLHIGGNLCDGCDISGMAGAGVTPDGPNNTVRNSYVHDNSCYGVDIGGGFTWTLYNNWIYNNGCGAAVNAGSIGTTVLPGLEDRIYNNTIVAGARDTDAGIYIKNGMHGSFFENNIIYGFPRGIAHEACGYSPSSGTCQYTDANTIRNNLIVSSPAGREIVQASSPAIAPILTGNILNQNPLFVSHPTNLRIQSGSPAKDAGYNNGLATDKDGDTRANGVGTGTAIDIGADEYCASNCAVVATTAILNVFSSGIGGASVQIPYTETLNGNPSSSCTPVSPVTTSTTSKITCAIGAQIVFTAPPAAAGAPFGRWTECTSTNNGARTCTKLLNSGSTVSASFGGTTRLTLQTSPNYNVPITITPPDLDGVTSCKAYPCILRYTTDTPVVIDAPDYFGSSFFGGWLNCPGPGNSGGPNYHICSSSMGADITVTPIYDGDGCHIKKDLTKPPWNQLIGLPVTICSDAGSISIFQTPDVGPKLGEQGPGATGTIVADSTFTTQPYVFDNDSDYVKVDFSGAAPSGTPPTMTNPDGWMLTNTLVTSSVLQTTLTSCSPGACTSLPSAPPQITSTTATFSWTSTGGTAPHTYTCSLDNAAFSTCTSPKQYLNLTVAPHNFRVRATDSAVPPVTDSTPATFSWEVVLVAPPVVTIKSNPTSTTTSTSATFTFDATSCGPPCVFQCEINNAPFVDCSSGTVTYTGVPSGSNTFFVKAINPAGGISTIKTYQWTVTPTGSGAFTTGTCVKIIAANGPDGNALNVTTAWLGAFSGRQPFDATGIITDTNATLNPQGRTGIRVNWRTPLNITVNGSPVAKNSELDRGDLDPDGWVSLSTGAGGNLTEIPCPGPVVGPATPVPTAGIGAGIIKLGGTVK